MKKIMYLSIMLLAVAITGCEKSDEEPTAKTFEQKYPEWRNLTWISTTPTKSSTYKLDIRIVDNLITLTFTDVNNVVTLEKFRDMDIKWNIVGETNSGPVYSDTNGTVYFGEGISPADKASFGFVINRTEKTITLDNTYKLKIN